MKPITRLEQFLATAAGEYDGELPAPITRQEQYLKKIIDQIDGGGSVSPEQIDAAIEAYLNSHDADIVTEQELSDELSEYYNKTDIDNALGRKADIDDIPDISGLATTASVTQALSGKVDMVSGRGLSEANFTAEEKNKLAGIEENAKANVNADWNSTTGDSRILNKPENLVQDANYVHTDTNFTADEKQKLANIASGSQVNTIESIKVNGTAQTITNKEVDVAVPTKVSDLTNDSNFQTQDQITAAIAGKQNTLTFDTAPTQDSTRPVESGGVYSALASKIDLSLKGANSGVAELDSNGKVPSSQLPSYVDDVVEGYYDSSTQKFYEEFENDTYATEIAGEAGKIYVAIDTNISYRWGGNDVKFVEISSSLALGETSATAYAGNKGKANAYAISALETAVGDTHNLQTTTKTSLVSAVNELNSGKANSSHTHSNATASSNGVGGSAGLMSASDKEKLDGIQTMTTEEVEDAFDPSTPVTPSGNTNYFLRGDKVWAAPAAVGTITRSGLTYTATRMNETSFSFDIPTGNTSSTVAAGNHTHSAMGGATQSAAGTSGFVPAPAIADQYNFLRGDGTWVPSNGIQTVSVYDNSVGVDVSSTLNIASLSGCSYVEIYYLQETGVGVAKGIISNGATAQAIQLMKYVYNSNDASLAIHIGTVVISGTTLTLSSSDTFKIYRVVGYK